MFRFAAEAVAETLWPTRCAVCDMPGSVLCDRCADTLPYVDWWRACRRCGSPFGLVQCDACSPPALSRLGRDKLPYDACASTVAFDGRTGRIVRVYKDQGEQRLAAVMAECMLRILPPDWPVDAVTFVPATLSAYRYRGFDHAEHIALNIARGIGVESLSLLSRPRTRDQRNLSARQRIENLAGSFRASDRPGSDARDMRLLLVDDVCTTGATLCAAAEAVRSAGAREVRCLTFARV